MATEQIMEVELADGEARMHGWIHGVDDLRAGSHVTSADADDPERRWLVLRVIGSRERAVVEAMGVPLVHGRSAPRLDR